MRSSREDWQDTRTGEAHTMVLGAVREIDQAQWSITERLYKQAYLYDRYDNMFYGFGDDLPGLVDENVIKPAVDTAASLISRMRPRVRCQTEGASWSAQRRAQQLETYIEGLFKQTRIFDGGVASFTDAGVVGTGSIKIYPKKPTGKGKRWKLAAEHIVWDELVVDESRCRDGRPTQMHHRRMVDRRKLIAEYPDREGAIDRAGTVAIGTNLRWTGQLLNRDIDAVAVVESWQLPMGDKPGRWTVCIEGATLKDEEWKHDWFPFVHYHWARRMTGFWGRSVVEDIAGHQVQANNLSWTIDQVLLQVGAPRVLVHVADQALGLKLNNEIGAIVPWKSREPKFIQVQGLINDYVQRLEGVKRGALQVIGISQLSAQGTKPAGLESAVALREYQDSETARFAIQAQTYEQMYVDAARIMVAWCKELGDGAPVVWAKGNDGPRQIEWSKVDLDDVPYTLDLDAASAMARTSAGRTQTVIEWMQGGLISTDEGRHLLAHPDLKSSMSLYNAAIEDIDATIEQLLDGEVCTPEPFQNLAMGLWRVQMKYLAVKHQGAPEEVLDGLRNWMTQAQDLANKAAPPSQAPQGPAPQAALAAPAMQLAPS